MSKNIPMFSGKKQSKAYSEEQLKGKIIQKIEMELTQSFIMVDEMEKRTCSKVCFNSSNTLPLSKFKETTGYYSCIAAFMTGYLLFERIFFPEERRYLEGLVIPMTWVDCFHRVEFPQWWDRRFNHCKKIG